jgi:hypothetical protein
MNAAFPRSISIDGAHTSAAAICVHPSANEHHASTVTASAHVLRTSKIFGGKGFNIAHF